jgi:hypothetical protein
MSVTVRGYVSSAITMVTGRKKANNANAKIIFLKRTLILHQVNLIDPLVTGDHHKGFFLILNK